jgi:endopeptidase La
LLNALKSYKSNNIVEPIKYIELKSSRNKNTSDKYEESSEDESSDDEKVIRKSNKRKSYDDFTELVNKNTYNKKSKLPNVRDFLNQMNKVSNIHPEDEIKMYYNSLSEEERIESENALKELNEHQTLDKPTIFKILDMPLPISQKNNILKQYNTLLNNKYGENKLKNWFDAVMSIPFGQYKGINLQDIKTKNVKKFLDNLITVMDKAVYGHEQVKRKIVQMMAQKIRNPLAKGSILGIWGPAGNGKTTIIKEGIAKAMDKPFVFISLGGASDSSFLEGHSYTYEGSVYGRIMNGIITSKCMDPIIYFDELDKISNTHKGEEITNILIHLTDPTQNTHFRDKYFHGIDIDLSRATMIFSYNDPSKVNPILLDRITTVETKYLLPVQKKHIATNYLLPEIIKDMGLNNDDVVINDDVVDDLINNYTREGGVRKLKSLLYIIVRELNLSHLLKHSINDVRVEFPFVVDKSHIPVFLKDKNIIEPEKIHTEDKIGVINGMWANSIGQGGHLPIHVLWVPSTTPFDVKATGNLQKVIKESTQVASTLAFNYLAKDLQDKYLKDWKERPFGIHIHCPDGSVPKDGPSAGAALSLVIYSLLTNRKIRHDVAITGEINLQGEVTAIGGLENKLEGSKKAGVTLALYPKENEKDIIKIQERNPTLFDDNFKVVSIESFNDVIKYALV